MGQGLRYQVCTYCECRTPALAPGNWCEYAVSDPASTDCMAIMVKPTYVQTVPAGCLPPALVRGGDPYAAYPINRPQTSMLCSTFQTDQGWLASSALVCLNMFLWSRPVFLFFFFYLTVLYHKVTFPLRHRRHVEVTVLGVVKPPEIYNLHPHLSLFLSC
jgi:hypothetical protein